MHGSHNMLEFQRYQLEFTAHIRNPKANKKPVQVDDARMAVYREIVFNNIFGAVSACFPVCVQVLGKHAWDKLVRQFFANYQATSPIFREIPQQFLPNTCTHTGKQAETALKILVNTISRYTAMPASLT